MLNIGYLIERMKRWYMYMK